MKVNSRAADERESRDEERDVRPCDVIRQRSILTSRSVFTQSGRDYAEVHGSCAGEFSPLQRRKDPASA